MTDSELPKTLPEAHALIRALITSVEKQARRIEELERRLGQNSQNSSRPPSSDPPGTRPQPKERPSGRKPGGQPGHEGHERSLLPPEKVDRVEELWPERCENCAHDLGREKLRDEIGEAARHQVTEMPPVRPEVVEYRQHSQFCPKCYHTTTAELPPEVPISSFGPRLQAVASMLSGVYRLSKRSVKSLLLDLFGVEISLGAIIACEQRTSAALAEPVAEAHAYVQQQAVANADETGWRERARRAWLWVAVTAHVTIFLIHARRGAVAAEKLLGRFAGILGSDRWCAYANYRLRRRQLCWAHLRRHFEAFAEYSGEAGTIGDALVLLTEKMFRYWHWVRDGTWARSTFQTRMRPLRKAIEVFLQRGRVCGQPKVEATCRELLEYAPALWTFVRVRGVEPTNNASERALRTAVIMRKTSFGTHSENGSRFIERMLSVVATLRQQNRDVLGYLVETCERALLGRRPRSLLPGGRIMTAQALAHAQVSSP